MSSVHIQQTLQSGCILSTRLMGVISETDTETVKLHADYVSPDYKTLQKYFYEFAPALRDDFKTKFPEITSVSKTIVKQLSTEDC
ncbi:MAG: DUF4286 family protein [Ignavibacteriaceae bacterium]|nr:DUF4286 family protein [Ignavibacteriaceae bacterium]